MNVIKESITISKKEAEQRGMEFVVLLPREAKVAARYIELDTDAPPEYMPTAAAVYVYDSTMTSRYGKKYNQVYYKFAGVRVR